MTTPIDAEKAEKALRKLEAEKGPLSPEDRYKALVNAVKQAQDVIEHGDRKARFALVIMSVLNAVAVLLAMRGGAEMFPSTGAWGVAVRVELLAYAVVTAYYIWQAISALRPRGVTPPAKSELPASITPATSMRVLFHADAVARDKAEYRQVWDHLRMDNLTTELADQLHTLSVINQAKYSALDRLYFGLGVMMGLLALLLGTLGLYFL